MRRRRRIACGSAVLAATLAGALLGGFVAEAPSRGATVVEPSSALAERSLAGIAQGSTQATVAKLETSLASSPGDPDALASLGLAYQIRWRETGDAGFLPAPRRRCKGLSPPLLPIRQRRSVARTLPSSAISFAMRSSSGGGHIGLPRTLRDRSESSAMQRSSSAATAPRSRPSSEWCRSSRASPRTPASRTRES